MFIRCLTENVEAFLPFSHGKGNVGASFVNHSANVNVSETLLRLSRAYKQTNTHTHTLWKIRKRKCFKGFFFVDAFTIRWDREIWIDHSKPSPCQCNRARSIGFRTEQWNRKNPLAEHIFLWEYSTSDKHRLWWAVASTWTASETRKFYIHFQYFRIIALRQRIQLFYIYPVVWLPYCHSFSFCFVLHCVSLNVPWFSIPIFSPVENTNYSRATCLNEWIIINNALDVWERLPHSVISFLDAHSPELCQFHRS